MSKYLLLVHFKYLSLIQARSLALYGTEVCIRLSTSGGSCGGLGARRAGVSDGSCGGQSPTAPAEGEINHLCSGTQVGTDVAGNTAQPHLAFHFTRRHHHHILIQTMRTFYRTQGRQFGLNYARNMARAYSVTRIRRNNRLKRSLFNMMKRRTFPRRPLGY